MKKIHEKLIRKWSTLLEQKAEAIRSKQTLNIPVFRVVYPTSISGDILSEMPISLDWNNHSWYGYYLDLYNKKTTKVIQEEMDV